MGMLSRHSFRLVRTLMVDRLLALHVMPLPPQNTKMTTAPLGVVNP